MSSQDNRLLPLSALKNEAAVSVRELAQTPASYAGSYAASQQAHLRDYLMVVLKRKWLITSLVVVVTCLVALQMYRLPSEYQAETTIQIEPKKSVLSSNKEAIVLNTAARDQAYWNTQLQLLQNPILARQVVLTLDLQHNPAFLGSQSAGLLSKVRRILRREGVASKPSESDGGVPVVDQKEVDNSTLTPEQLAALEPYEDRLRDNLEIVPIEKTNLVNIRFRHTSPEIARKVADTLASVFIYNDYQRDVTGSETASGKLAREISELQLKIRQQEETRLNYLQHNNLPLNPTVKGLNLPLTQLETYSQQLLQAENDRKNLEAALRAAEGEKNVWDVPEVGANERVQKLRDKLIDLQQMRANRIAELEQKRNELLVNYTPEWPEVKKVDQQIETIKNDTEQTKRLEEELNKAPKEVLQSLRAKYASAVDKERKTREAYERARAAANLQSEAEIQMKTLDQEIETSKQFYNTLFQRQKELEITSGDRANNISIATPARTPHEPIGPPRVRNIIIAFLLSLIAGIGLAFLLDYLDDTLNTPEDIDRHIHLPVLGIVPAPRSTRRLLKGRTAAVAAEADNSTALALIEDTRSPVAEAYRHLRTSLLLSSAGEPPKVILITSSQPSEGKTTTAVNTAMMLAQTGAEVLIIDCDLRRPRIHHHFGLANARGVANFLSGSDNRGSITELIQSCPSMPNLKIMPSGPVPPRPAELLGSQQMRRLVDLLRESFDHIIIDSPPAVSFTDASILSTIADGVMLVVHGGRSSRAIVRRAKQLLLDVGAHVFGIVLNNVKMESHSYYYSGYYGYYYSSYYSSDDEAEAGADESEESHEQQVAAK